MERTQGNTVFLKDKGDFASSCLPGIHVRGAVRSASYYRSAFELLEAETILPELDDDFMGFLRSFDDYESVGYLCLNGEIVLFCDDINGMVFSAGKVEDILQSVREYYAESNA